MILKFQKTENGDITARILNDKEVADFSYIQMIKALMNGQQIDCEYEGLTEEEQSQIENLKEDIWKKIYPEENGSRQLFPNM